jgi:hypothetical protein
VSFFAQTERKEPAGAFLALFLVVVILGTRFGCLVVAVFVFEVVEPFFSLAAAPQHIPS